MRLRRTVVIMTVLGVASACSGHRPVTRPAAVVATPTLPPVGPPRPSTTTTTTVKASVPTTPTTVAPVVRVSVAGAALAPFPTCGDFLAFARSEAHAEVTPWGLSSPMVDMRRTPNGAATPGAAQAAPAAPASDSAGAGAAPTSSTTNNQEAGVDEPDMAKTDGHLLVTLRSGAGGPEGYGQRLQVVDVSGARPVLRGTLATPQGPSGLFLVGSEAVLLATTWPTSTGSPNEPPPAPTTQVSVVSVANPDHPTVVRTFSVDGSEVAARLIGHSIKLVVTGGPRIAFPAYTGSTPDAEAKAIATNRAIIARAPLEQWLPAVIDGAGHRQPADCGLVNHASEPSGVGTLSVVTVDPDLPQPGAAVTVLGNPGAVYASTTNLYVATTSFAVQQAESRMTPVNGERTLIHAFGITDPARATYLGSGAVPGVVLNQYSLSEYAGNLRVATTTGTPSPPQGEGGPVPAADGSQSLVTVLHAQGGALAQIGQVGGLGKGQRIYGVRFAGPLGYVVTFRQLDPLYVVDLSNPVHPAVRGALELSGYSAYLDPVGTGLLLGVGASADSQGHRTGLQVSLFNVGDPAHPTLVGQDLVNGAYASVENDPHAFLWWAATAMAVLPVQQWSNQSGANFVGALVVRVTGAKGVVEMGRLTHDRFGGQGGPPPYPPGKPAPQPPGKPAPQPAPGGPAQPAPPQPAPGVNIERALVVGSRLYTLSERGVLASDLNTLADVAWLPYA